MRNARFELRRERHRPPALAHTCPNSGPITTRQLLTLSSVPHEVTETVERVEREGEGDEGLAGNLDPGGEVVDEVDEVGRVNGGVEGVEAVGEGTDVEETAESDTGNTVETGEVPGELGLVDLKVGRVGAVHALLVEELVLLLLGDRVGLHSAAEGGDARRDRTGSGAEGSWG